MAGHLSKAKVDAKTPKYQLEFLESALEEWKRLDGSIRQVLKKLLERRLNSPRVPGAEFHGELADCYKIKLRKQGYRLVYQVRDRTLVVLVIAVDRRDKDKVYEAAIMRIRKMVADAVDKVGKQAAKRR